VGTAFPIGQGVTVQLLPDSALTPTERELNLEYQKAVASYNAQHPPATTVSPPVVEIPPVTRGGAQNIASLKKFPSLGGDNTIQTLVFPVNPETFTLTHHRDSQDVPLLAYGTRSRPGALQPREVSFDAFFPNPDKVSDTTNWINLSPDDLYDPWGAVRLLGEWQDSDVQKNGMSPLLLTVADTSISMYVMITQFDVSTKPREIGDVYFSVTFRETLQFPAARPAPPRPKPVKTGRTTSTTRPNPRAEPTSITTLASDNLRSVAMRAYHVSDTRHVDALYNANKAKIGPSPTVVLKGGIKLVVPDVN